MQYSIDSKIKLNNGIEMPIFGLGTFESGLRSKMESAVALALRAGYRLVDTAEMYHNEDKIGRALKNSVIPREEIFITTKVWPSHQGYDRTMRAFEESLEKLDTDYVDLYLIHWPVDDLSTWKALVDLFKNGKAKSIGVSNYSIKQMKQIMAISDVIPAVNQIEFSPFNYRREILDFCQENKIQLEAYSPLTRGKKFKHPVIKELARKYDRTPAQILLRWVLQHNIIVIPKSSHEKRIQENAAIFDFEISIEDMKKLDALDEGFRLS